MYTPKATSDAQKDIANHVLFELESDFEPTGEECVFFAAYFLATRHKTDVDNYLKLTLDALNEILYTDDTLVSNAFIEKEYCKEHPRSFIGIISKKSFDAAPEHYYSAWREAVQNERKRVRNL